MRARTVSVVLGLLLPALAGCGGGADARGAAPTPSSASPSRSGPSSASTPSPATPVTPAATASPSQRLAMTCRGRRPPAGGRSPTVVLVTGLATSRTTFDGLARELRQRHRVCTYDRAGVGDSPPLRRRDPDPWPGNAADALAETLAARGERAPYVLLGWSYGGLVVQSFTERHGDQVAGLVLEDSSAAEQFVDEAWDHITWDEGGRLVDTRRTARALRRVDLGTRPTVVLTSDAFGGAARDLWDRYQDRLAASSSDAVHVEAIGAPHAIHQGNQRIVATAVDAVVAVVERGGRLAPCPRTFRPVGGRCVG